MKIINRLSAKDPNFKLDLAKLLNIDTQQNNQITIAVSKILSDIKEKGDLSLLEYTNKYDRLNIKSVDLLEIQKIKWKEAFDNLKLEQRSNLEKAAERIKQYHQKQIMNSWSYKDEYDNILGQRISPLEKVGLYVPGGKAAYPSSVMMNAIPAKVAGVNELIMVSPATNGIINSLVLSAAFLSNVDRLFTIGGAQAIAALTYGTNLIPAVDKIVGPGNSYVAEAKRQVFGKVGIDMIAGPSEILIICDGKTPIEWIVMDLFSQAEHDELAQSILLCPDIQYLNKIEAKIKELLPNMPRKEIIASSLYNRGLLILVENLEQACNISNFIAPEHLEISTEFPNELMKFIKHAGSIFLGKFSSESLGDYCAGPNHVLPTSRTSRFSSPLGVYDFQKRSSFINVSPNGANELGKIANSLAQEEGLQAHALSAHYRINY
ncbi:Histidinol dehydrogenase [Candidatus Kinetoplastibacterium sorsogonicusi]|uniref:Histidinol dehydrogenase n=1 Tax=Candidatus Kinetoplastidibacterium kentomonadis TaxID=1576550 RepID=A0A3Q8EWM5_9PROT|nr:histidinol dehydrogenase [Candidatus Kinetoplastibacterium sorsogonicusi]AWD32169.1 Histidinol dehydrogenase [Candidatus Kinetoplastibacterium sorsogonicusi]